MGVWRILRALHIHLHAFNFRIQKCFRIYCILDIRIRTHKLIQERLFGWSIPTFKIPDSKFLETRSNGFYFVFMHLRLVAKRIQTPKDSSGFEKSSLVETLSSTQGRLSRPEDWKINVQTKGKLKWTGKKVPRWKWIATCYFIGRLSMIWVWLSDMSQSQTLRHVVCILQTTTKDSL